MGEMFLSQFPSWEQHLKTDKRQVWSVAQRTEDVFMQIGQEAWGVTDKAQLELVYPKLYVDVLWFPKESP